MRLIVYTVITTLGLVVRRQRTCASVVKQYIFGRPTTVQTALMLIDVKKHVEIRIFLNVKLHVHSMVTVP